MFSERSAGGLSSWIWQAVPLVRQRLHRSPFLTRLAKGTFWTVCGTALGRVLGLASSMLAARFLTKISFGELGIIQSTVGLFGTFAGLGLGVTATKYVAQWRDTERERCGHVVVLILFVALGGSLLASTSLGLASGWLAARTLAAPQLTPLLRASCPLVLFTTLQNVYSGALAGFEAFRAIACLNVVGGVVGAPLVVVGAMEFGLEGAVFGLVVQSAVACLAGHILLVHEGLKTGTPLSFWPRGAFSKEWLQDAPILWRFSLPAFLSSTLVGPVNWWCNMLLVNQPNGYGQAALLSAANQWKNLVGFLPLMLSSVLVPMLAHLHAAGRRSDFIKLLKRQMIFSAGLCLCLSLPLMIFSTAVMRCYGADFRDGVPVLVLTLGTTAIAALNNLLSRSMQSAGRAWLDLGFSGVWSAALVGVSLVLIPRYGALGVVVAQAAAAGVLGIWQWQVLRRMLRWPQEELAPVVRAEI